MPFGYRLVRQVSKPIPFVDSPVWIHEASDISWLTHHASLVGLIVNVYIHCFLSHFPLLPTLLFPATQLG